MSNTIRVIQGSRPTSSVVVKSGAGLTITNIGGVDASDLGTGYTLVYDAATKKFKTQLLDILTLGNVDSTDLQDGYSLIYDAEAGKFKTQIPTIPIVDGGGY